MSDFAMLDSTSYAEMAVLTWHIYVMIQIVTDAAWKPNEQLFGDD